MKNGQRKRPRKRKRRKKNETRAEARRKKFKGMKWNSDKGKMENENKKVEEVSEENEEDDSFHFDIRRGGGEEEERKRGGVASSGKIRELHGTRQSINLFHPFFVFIMILYSLPSSSHPHRTKRPIEF